MADEPVAVTTSTLTTAIFGASDGLVATMALILATMRHGHKVVLAAVIGLLIAEGLGMAASQFLSDPTRNLRLATVMGVARPPRSFCRACPGPSPAAPWRRGRCLVGLLLAGVIARERRGGVATWLQTYGVLIGVGAIATLAGHIT